MHFKGLFIIVWRAPYTGRSTKPQVRGKNEANDASCTRSCRGDAPRLRGLRSACRGPAGGGEPGGLEYSDRGRGGAVVAFGDLQGRRQARLGPGRGPGLLRDRRGIQV